MQEADMSMRSQLTPPGGSRGPAVGLPSIGTSCWMKGQYSELRAVNPGPMDTQRSSTGMRTMSRSGSSCPMQACACRSTNATYLSPRSDEKTEAESFHHELRKELAVARERCSLCGQCPGYYPAGPTNGDEDARDCHAVVCLGPSPEHRGLNNLPNSGNMAANQPRQWGFGRLCIGKLFNPRCLATLHRWFFRTDLARNR